MITDKDIAEAEIIVNAVKAGRSVKDIAFRVSKIRAESAEQARKEAVERATCAWREHGEDITLRILRDAILSTVNESFTVAPVSTDAEKLALAELEKPTDEDAQKIAAQYAITQFDFDALGQQIQQYAEAYHARKLAEESAAILAASDRLGAALDEAESAKYE